MKPNTISLCINLGVLMPLCVYPRNCWSDFHTKYFDTNQLMYTNSPNSLDDQLIKRQNIEFTWHMKQLSKEKEKLMIWNILNHISHWINAGRRQCVKILDKINTKIRWKMSSNLNLFLALLFFFFLTVFARFCFHLIFVHVQMSNGFLFRFIIRS